MVLATKLIAYYLQLFNETLTIQMLVETFGAAKSMLVTAYIFEINWDFYYVVCLFIFGNNPILSHSTENTFQSGDTRDKAS